MPFADVLRELLFYPVVLHSGNLLACVARFPIETLVSPDRWSSAWATQLCGGALGLAVRLRSTSAVWFPAESAARYRCWLCVILLASRRFD